MADATHRLALVIQAKNEASKALQDVREDLGGVRDTASGMLQGLTSAIPGLGAILGGAGIAGGVLAAWKLGQQAIELGKVAAQAEGVRRGFEAMTPAADEMLAAMKRASKGSISEMGLMEAANRAMIMGVTDDAETMADMVAVAAARAGAVGMTTEEYFTRLVTGIGQLNPLMLRNLGIVFEADAAYSAYAQTLGTTADKLTEAQKREAALAAIMGDETTRALMAAEAAGMDAQDRFDALAASKADLSIAIGELVNTSQALQSVQEDLASVMRYLADEVAETAGAKRIASRMAEEYRGRLSELADQGELSAASLGLIDQRAAQMVDEFEAGNSTLEETNVNLDMLFAAVGGLVERTDLATVSEFEFREALAEVLATLHPYTAVVSEVPTLLDLAMQATADYGAMLGEQARDFDVAAESARAYAQALGLVGDELFMMEASGGMPKPTVRAPLVSASERYEIRQRQLDDERRAAERAAREHASAMESLYREQQAAMRSMAESILTPTTVTPADMFRAQTGALGGYVDKWDESARRLQDIANRGAASPWWEVLEIPDEVLAQGEEAVRIWAQETASAVQRGVRPDLIDWEAFDRAAEEFVRDQEAREQTIAMAMARLGGAVPEAEVRQMLGVPADAKEEALAVGLAFQQGLGSVDLARAVTDQMHEQMQAQMQRWVAMGSMTVTWFARGLEEGVADDTGLRIAKKLWPMIAPMIDSYLAKGVWN